MTHRFRNTAQLAVAVITGLVIVGCGSTATPAPTTGTSAPASAGSSGSAPATTQPPSAPATTQPPTTPGTPAQTTGLPAGYLPLFPFASLAQARAWRASYESGGHQPWHLSPDLTATAFAAFLGYTEVTQVAGRTVSAGDAHVEVGIKRPDGTISTAAVIHLVLFGSGRYAPWEVVGTDDTTFTLARPAYGSTVSSPARVGGTITGVDESIRVAVHTLSAQGPAGAYCCLAAGGTHNPWSATVTFHVTPGQVITIAAATGGHVAAVERFAVTGARVG
ncbi:MAG TPA: hypothetical protein VGS06_18990 [Streptosporangiaceae bacterium]|nr:hypothetical protein [Streptosporangiaceae bacterium]